MKKVFFGKVKDGKLKLDERDLFEAVVKRLEGKVVFITLDIIKSTRSLELNKYYFGVMVKILSQELGYELNEMHELLKCLFNSEKKYIKGQEIDLPQSTAILTNGEFMEYLERIKRWSAQEFNVYIPEPNEVEI